MHIDRSSGAAHRARTEQICSEGESGGTDGEGTEGGEDGGGTRLGGTLSSDDNADRFLNSLAIFVSLLGVPDTLSVGCRGSLHLSARYAVRPDATSELLVGAVDSSLGRIEGSAGDDFVLRGVNLPAC